VTRTRIALLTSALVLPLVLATSTGAAQVPYTVTALKLTVTVPNESLTGGPPQTCTIVADLYKPKSASSSHRVPAILTTNGFGGSKSDQAGIGRFGAAHGYAVLSYSGLGFGGSGCKISLDDPSYDGAAGSQLVSFLGGKAGIAKDTSGNAVTVTYVKHDRLAHDGRHHAFDPRVGMIGGSYGGQIQFAIAGVDPRLDTIIPIITWNDLAYSLAPNNTGLRHGVTYRNDAPGTEKFDWVSLFFGLGIVDGVEGTQVDPARNVGCPNFLTEACTAKAELDAGGFATQDVIDFARHASVTSYLKHIRIPTLLAQGQADTLFNLNEASATYRALRRQGTPVKMIWQSWGHSHGSAAPGEWSGDEKALSTYEGRRFFAWFDHYLKGAHVSTGPAFAYYRDWVPFKGSGPDTVQYAGATGFPVGRQHHFWLSGSKALVTAKSALRAGTASYSNIGGGIPTSYSETSEFQGSAIPDETAKPTDAQGTFSAWTSGRLGHSLDVVGIPTAHLHVSAPTTASGAPVTQLQFFAKIYDVAPSGSVDLVHRLVAPVRVFDATRAITVTLPGIVHRFAKGHRVELVIAATDAAYKNAYPLQPVTISTGPKSPSSLTLPVVGGAQAQPAGSGAQQGQATNAGGRVSGGALAQTGGSPLIAALGVIAVAMSLVSLRLRRRRPASRVP
jgi:ABC-2 type transport system ATP-binding protein